MATIHISEAEAERNFRGLMAHIRNGEEIIIESNAMAVATLSPAVRRPGQLLSQAIISVEKRGSGITLDADFSRDLEAVINSHREPLNPPPWD